MDEIKTKLKELKSMQETPDIYLFNYYSDLKQQVDLTFSNEQKEVLEEEKYIEIINSIKIFEQNSYKQIKPFNTFGDQIELIEQKLSDSDLEIDIIVKLIDKVKYEIEKTLFSNKSIMFIKDYGKNKESFLLIIGDEYLRMSNIHGFYYDHVAEDEFFEIFSFKDCFPDQTDIIMTREKLLEYFLVPRLFYTYKLNVINLDIEINSIDNFNFNSQKIKEIEPSTFSGLTETYEIDFSENQIKFIDPSTFNGLTNLREINFCNNQIEFIHQSTFNGLTSLEIIFFGRNRIKEIDMCTFNGLTKLALISFCNNEIKVIDPSILKGLSKLECMTFSNNKIKILDPSIFVGLTELKVIEFSSNQIKIIDPCIFHGLSNIELISFSHNQIETLYIQWLV